MTARESLRRHQAEYPVWAAPYEAQGCGPICPGVPMTEAQVLYVEAYTEYAQTRLKPWERRQKELQEAVEAEEREEYLF